MRRSAVPVKFEEAGRVRGGGARGGVLESDARGAVDGAREAEGVVLVSGFSKNLVKLFLRECEVSNPRDAMRAALDGEEYENLVVFD
ncbi:hypothetical protein Taro_049876 [Colocasia esculenta]|uniref:Uncharacterized protein n=1 Tax=Colocasia esculenta TaxID=4460 RepID=A0A843XC82_COLES|nr:hypothetical protein [Colocasia esculenta]